jgi:hypothetical protein
MDGGRASGGQGSPMNRRKSSWGRTVPADAPSMFQRVIAELKAIQDWDSRDFRITTPMEEAAVPIRKARIMELICKILEIAALN